MLTGAIAQVAQRGRQDAVKSLPSRLTEPGVVVDDACRVQVHFHGHHVGLGGFEQGIQAAQDGHRQDHVAALTAYVKVALNIGAYAQDDIGDPRELRLFHVLPLSRNCTSVGDAPGRQAGHGDPGTAGLTHCMQIA